SMYFMRSLLGVSVSPGFGPRRSSRGHLTHPVGAGIPMSTSRPDIVSRCAARRDGDGPGGRGRMSPLELVDPTTNPHLSGRFATVHREIDAGDLTVEGTLPAELTGAYVRNGPNPKFPPLGSYTYPMEGDGMLHGVWLDGDRPRYRNRWVETRGLQAEER